MRLYIPYVESQRSEADKGISMNANWNKELSARFYAFFSGFLYPGWIRVLGT
jgi:hypothetical protein